MSETTILLTGCDAKRCARRIHNEWDPGLEQTGWEVPADLRMRMDAGLAFEATVFGALRSAGTANSPE